MDITPIEFYALTPRNETWHCKRQAINSNLDHFDFINVIAAIESIHLSSDSIIDYQAKDFTIHCDDEVFSSEQHQDKVYSMVASYIIKQRQHHDHYPCYITDIDLCSYQQQLSSDNALQTIHYLKIQDFLEQKINLALKYI